MADGARGEDCGYMKGWCELVFNGVTVKQR